MLQTELIALGQRIEMFEGELTICRREDPRRQMMVETLLDIDLRSRRTLNAELGRLSG